ncbi:MAG: glycosyltransferase family 4 protein [Acidimicrobiia bacterium]|nr:glycosyltransferase family 4 protein [Acidimicrobiia bacterium]
MRILTITNKYPPHHLGGYELACWDVMRRMQAHGHVVHVLTTDMRLPGVDEGDERDVDRTLHFYWDDHELLSPPVWRRLAIERHNQRQLRLALDSFRPDVVSVWNMGAMSLGLLTTLEQRGVPMVLAICDDWLWYGPNLDAWMRLFPPRPTAGRLISATTRVPTQLPRLADAAFCFTSDFTRRFAHEHAYRGIEINIETITYLGIDRTDFPPTTPQTSEWRGRVLYVGRVDDRKGIETLIRAMALLPPENSLEIVGRGAADYVASLRALADECGVGDRVQFSVADRSALREKYAAADVFVFPSEWDEPFGLVPIEAMACGTPVIGTGSGGSAEFMHDGANCLRYPPGDAPALAAAIRRLAESPELRARLAAGGAVTADELDIDVVAELLEAWHVAAAARFVDGRPPDRPPPGSTLARAAR